MVINMLKKSNQLELSFSKHTELYDILIKPDNFWRQLSDMVDFSFVYEELKEVADVVEHNAASAEENTAISQELNACAQSLKDMADSFELK